MNLLCVGSIANDTIITPFHRKNNVLGGSATYCSLAGSLFCKTIIVGVVGSDFTRFDVFRRRNIDTSGIQIRKGKTFTWTGHYGFDLNTRQTLSLKLNVFKHFQPQLLPRHQQAKCVFLANIQPRLQLEVLKQIKHPKLIGLDTATEWINWARKDLLKVLKQADIFVINESEVREFSKEYNLLKAARKILSLMQPHHTVKRMDKRTNSFPALIIKQGEHGLLAFNRSHSYRDGLPIFNLPGYPLENVVDPTGAGDAFAGGLMGFLAETGDFSLPNLKRACTYATMIASFCVEDFGPKFLENLTLAKIRKRLRLFKKLTDFKI